MKTIADIKNRIKLDKKLASIKNGLSAYEIAVKQGFGGSEEMWLKTLKGDGGSNGKTGDEGAQGEKGEKGDEGAQGEQGAQGAQGEKGDEGAQGEKGDEGAQGAQGSQGNQGLSAYQIAVSNGFSGTQAQWLAQSKTIVDTRENIFAQTPENGTIGFSTDKGEKYLYADGWQQASTVYRERTGAFDIGAIQYSNLGGYGRNYISQKHLADVTIGGNSETKEGGVRTIFSQTLQKRIAQYYLDGAWQTALTGVNIETDSDETPADIEFTDFKPYKISLITGNSDSKDINGVPVVQNMKTDMGAFQSPLEINGGTF